LYPGELCIKYFVAVLAVIVGVLKVVEFMAVPLTYITTDPDAIVKAKFTNKFKGKMVDVVRDAVADPPAPAGPGSPLKITAV
jgi:hypothetical protein